MGRTFSEHGKASLNLVKRPKHKGRGCYCHAGQRCRQRGVQRLRETDAGAEEHYADRTAKYSRIVHAETNAILLARGDVRGFTLYCTFPPCDRCAVQIIQAGIIRVACPRAVESEAAERWRTSFETARQYFGESGVTLVEV